jgi:hypothetical protein
VSIDIAERNGALLRRWLLSADRFSDRAIAFGLFFENTLRSSVSASLVSVTRWDQRFAFLCMRGR